MRLVSRRSHKRQLRCDVGWERKRKTVRDRGCTIGKTCSGKRWRRVVAAVITSGDTINEKDCCHHVRKGENTHTPNRQSFALGHLSRKSVNTRFQKICIREMKISIIQYFFIILPLKINKTNSKTSQPYIYVTIDLCFPMDINVIKMNKYLEKYSNEIEEMIKR